MNWHVRGGMEAADKLAVLLKTLRRAMLMAVSGIEKYLTDTGETLGG